MLLLCRYDYGSTGILEYYQHKLLDIVQYPDARTELFHNFRYIRFDKHHILRLHAFQSCGVGILWDSFHL